MQGSGVAAGGGVEFFHVSSGKGFGDDLKSTGGKSPMTLKKGHTGAFKGLTGIL